MKLTPEAHKKIIKTLSEEGFCELQLTRLRGDRLKVALVHDGEEVMVMPQFQTIPEGSTLVISGIKIKLELKDD